MASEYSTGTRGNRSLLGLVLGPTPKSYVKLLTEALGNDGECHCVALGYTKEQCRDKECHCIWCAPLASWLFCDELVIQEEGLI